MKYLVTRTGRTKNIKGIRWSFGRAIEMEEFDAQKYINAINFSVKPVEEKKKRKRKKKEEVMDLDENKEEVEIKEEITDADKPIDLSDNPEENIKLND